MILYDIEVHYIAKNRKIDRYLGNQKYWIHIHNPAFEEQKQKKKKKKRVFLLSRMILF